MDSVTFNDHLMHMQGVTVDTLTAKAAEYAREDDRLHNFKVAAAVQGISPTAALAGMMAKHTVSVYDMIGDGEVHPMELWEEKIKDSINYLFILWALLHEEY
jgi:transketolase N-terminal domain/subunit